MSKITTFVANTALVAMFVSVHLWGCTRGTSTTIVETSHYVLKEQNGTNPFDENFYSIDADIEYPPIQDNLTDSIMFWIYDVVCHGSDYDEYLADAKGVKSIEDLIVTIKKACIGSQGFHEFKVKKVCESPLFVTFTSQSGFSAGNSGYYLNQAATFRKSDGHKLSISDLTDKSFNELKESIWKFYDSKGLGEEYSHSMKKEVNQFNISLYKDEIVFSYPHTMHGAVTDPCDIAIPLSEAKHIFKKNFDWWNQNDEVLDYTKKDTEPETKKESNEEAIKEIQTRVEEIYRKIFNYEDYEEGQPYDPDKIYMSSEYKKLLAEAEEGADGIVLDGDHWTCSQDPLKPSMRILSVKRMSTTEAIAQIVVTDSAYQWEGEYYEKPVKLILIKEGGTWLVDDFITDFEGQEFSEKAYLKECIQN